MPTVTSHNISLASYPEDLLERKEAGDLIPEPLTPPSFFLLSKTKKMALVFFATLLIAATFITLTACSILLLSVGIGCASAVLGLGVIYLAHKVYKAHKEYKQSEKVDPRARQYQISSHVPHTASESQEVILSRLFKDEKRTFKSLFNVPLAPAIEIKILEFLGSADRINILLRKRHNSSSTIWAIGSLARYRRISTAWAFRLLDSPPILPPPETVKKARRPSLFIGVLD